MIRVVRESPKTASWDTTAMTMRTNKSWGIESMMSTNRINASSTSPPKYPEMAPTASPMEAPKPTMEKEKRSDQSDPRRIPW